MSILENLQGKKNNGDLFAAPLTKEKAERLVAGITDRKYKALLLLGFNTGISFPEALNVKISDITFKEQTIWIEDREKKRKRLVVAPSHVLDYLKITQNGNLQIDLPIFPMDERRVKDELPKQADKVLGFKIGWVCVRETYATLAVAAGHPLDMISENTGLSVKFLGQFLKTMPEDRRSAANTRPVVRML